MAKQTIKIRRKKTKSHQKKTGGDSGYVKCNMCNGTGRHKKAKSKK